MVSVICCLETLMNLEFNDTNDIKVNQIIFLVNFLFISTLQEYASSEELTTLKEEVSKLTRELEAKALELNRMKEEQTQSNDLHTAQLKSVS